MHKYLLSSVAFMANTDTGADTPSDTENDEVMATEEQIQQLRTLYLEQAGEECPLDDDTLADIVANAPEGDEADAEYFMEEMKEAVIDAASEGMSADQRATEATRFAEKAAQDQLFNEHAAKTWESDEWKRRAAMVLYDDILRIYGKEAVNGMPVPGSKDGNNPALFNVTVDGRAVPHDWYNDFLDGIPVGKNFTDQYNAVLARKANMNKIDFDREKNKWDQRRKSLRDALKKGMRVHFHIMDITNKLPGVTVEIDRDEHGQLTNTTYPITLGGPKRKDWLPYTVDQFLRLNVAKAMEKGGTFEALRDTAVRAPKKKGTQPAATPAASAQPAEQPVANITISNLYPVLTGVAHFMDNADTLRALYLALNAPPEKSDELVRIVGDLAKEFGTIMARPAMKARYDKLAGPVQSQQPGAFAEIADKLEKTGS